MRAAVVLLLVLAGCVEPDTARRVDAPGPVDDAMELVAPTFFAPVSLGWAGRAAEPSMTVAPDGTVYVAAAPQLWRSDDGRAFTAIGEPRCEMGPNAACVPGATMTVAPLAGFTGGDTALGTDANGTVYFLGLDENGALPFQVSRDRGETWSEARDIADGNASDRQWMHVTPAGVVHATWRDFGREQQGPDQLLYRRSPDGGATWEPARVIGPDPDIAGPLARDARTGALYTPFYGAGVRVARSLDEGLTWTTHEVTAETRDTTLRAGRPLDLFPVVAVDDAGTVYVAWAADAPDEGPMGSKDVTFPRVWLAASTDGADSWSEPRALSPEGKVAAFPWLVAGAPGRVALTWYEGRLGTPGQTAPEVWDVALAMSVDANAAEPTFVTGRANAEPAHVGGMCRSGGACEQECLPLAGCFGQDRSRSEVFEMALRDGMPIVAWVADAAPPMRGIEVHVGGVESGTPLR